MGEEVEAQEFTRADRTRHREKIRRNLDVFARMLREAAFDTDDPMCGLEEELNLVDDRGDPALKNAEALALIADPDFQTELGQFNIEINVPPVHLHDDGLTRIEEHLRGDLNDAEAKSSQVGAHLVMIGILPTLDHKTAIKNYLKALNKGVLKVISKMGISTIQSYRGAQIFEAIGLDKAFVDRYFTWTANVKATMRDPLTGADMSQEAVGSCSSRDKLLGKKAGEFKAWRVVLNNSAHFAEPSSVTAVCIVSKR